MKNIEYAIWGTKKGVEDIIRVNGSEVQNKYSEAKKIKEIIDKRKEFSSTRIQKIDYNNYDTKKSFAGTIKKRRY